MVQANDAIAELRELFAGDWPIDFEHSRQLILRATRHVSDRQKARSLAHVFELRFAALEMAEFIGTDRALELAQILEILDEIERLSQPSNRG